MTKKVLYHYRTRGTGAEGVHISGIANGFEKLGYEVLFESPTGHDPRDSRGDNPYESRKENFTHKIARNLPQFAFEVAEYVYSVGAANRLVARAKEVSWIYERSAFFGFAAERACRKTGIPFALEVNEVVGPSRVRGQVFTRQARKIERQVFEAATGIFPVTQFLADRILELGIEPSKVHVIPNGVDESLFFKDSIGNIDRSRYGLSDDDFAFAFIGWFVEWHKLDQLILAFAPLAKSDARFKLVLAGDGLLGAELSGLAKSLGIADQVLFPGAIEYNEIPHFLNAMDVGVVPQVNEFRSPIKLFEYMASELCVVAGKVPAVETVLPKYQQRFLFDQADQSDLERALREAAGCDTAVGSKNRSWCERHYTYQIHAARISEIMERAIS